MEGKQTVHFCKTYARPNWPYEDWTCIEKEVDVEDDRLSGTKFDEPMPVSDISTITSDDLAARDSTTCAAEINVLQKTESVDKNDQDTQDTSTEALESYEPDHWSYDLSEPLDDDLPLCQLLRFMEPELNYSGAQSKKIFEEINEMMRKTIEKLESCYLVFEKCSLIPVGSVNENTKIGKADEFDYAVVLPYFESFEKLFPIIFKKDESLLYDDPAYVALVDDIAWGGDTKHIKENFQAAMKQVWSLYMEDFLPEGWKLSESTCHGDEQSIARTVHLVRSSDGFIVNIDICFWIPIHKSVLEEKGFDVEQRDFLLKNCLDGEMKLFALLPKDRGIEYALNSPRFAMSLKEREELNKYGPLNGRIQCYKFAKCIAKFFVPYIQKKENCCFCLDGLVSSFALKNIVLYMANNYPDDKMWAEDQFGNRVSEVFAILNFCMKVNCSEVSAFLTPYTIPLRTHSAKYDSGKGVLIEKGADGPYYEEDHCLLPEVERFESLFTKDLISKKILQNYFSFLHEYNWCVPEVFDRLTEMLTGLTEKDDEERREYAENPGCLCFQTFTAEDFAL